MKPKSGGQSNHIGTRVEEGQCYKNIASQYEECYFCFLNYYAAKSMKCNSVCCLKCSVWYNEICVGAKTRDSSLVVDVTNHNCTTSWSELYLQMYFSTNCRKFFNFCI